jgi:hypothetical protein
MDRFRAALLLGVAFAPLLMAYPLPANALSLKEALVTTYATNPQIESARANLRAYATKRSPGKQNAGRRPTPFERQ